MITRGPAGLFCIVSVAMLFCSCQTKRSEQPGIVDANTVDPRTAPLMRQKLRHMHNILDALAVRGFAVVERDAKQLVELAEQAEWHIHKTEAYVVFSQRFADSARLVAQTAHDQDLQAASEAYLEMTRQCVACHGYLIDAGLYRDMPGPVTSLRRTGEHAEGI